MKEKIQKKKPAKKTAKKETSVTGEVLVAFADGSSLGNPGPGGWGMILASGTEVVERGGRETHTTNNRMELTAAINALRAAKEIIGIGAVVVVHTDSSYVINGITKWVFGWKKKGWITSTKEPVINQDLWEELVAAVAEVSPKWKYVRGHQGIPGNERVDTIATAFASGSLPELYRGARKDYSLDALLSITEPVAGFEPQRGHSSKSASRPKGAGYSYLSLVNGVLVRHATWAECEARVKGTKGARYKKAMSPFDEKTILSDWGVSL